MNDIVRQKLCELVRSMEPGLLDQPQRLRGILSDECPGCRREVNVLLTALQHRVAADLQTRSANLPWAIQAARLVKRLVEDAALSEDAARWAVDSWGLALGATSAVAPPLVPAPVPAPAGPAVAVAVRAEPRTSHAPSLILLVFFAGLWFLIVWLCTGWIDGQERSRAKRDKKTFEVFLPQIDFKENDKEKDKDKDPEKK